MWSRGDHEGWIEQRIWLELYYYRGGFFYEEPPPDPYRWATSYTLGSC